MQIVVARVGDIRMFSAGASDVTTECPKAVNPTDQMCAAERHVSSHVQTTELHITTDTDRQQ